MEECIIWGGGEQKTFQESANLEEFHQWWLVGSQESREEHFLYFNIERN